MHNFHQRWKDKFEALSLRERILFLMAIVAAFYMTWDMMLMDRVRNQQKIAVTQLKKWQQQIADIDARIQVVTAGLSGKKQTENKQRIEDLKTQINDVNQSEKHQAVRFIRPAQMVDVLKGLLAGEQGLRLTSLQSQAAQPLIHKILPATDAVDPASLKRGKPEKLFQAGPQAEAQTSKTPDDVRRGTATPPEVYQHGLEMVFQGDYNNTLNYLKKLQRLPWKFYWDEVRYEVLEYPKVRISLRIHTLSLEKGWIGV